MLDEIIPFHAKNTWESVPFTLDRSLIDNCWIYIVTVSFHDQVDHLKAHLVAKADTQVYGQDHSDTFSFVSKMSFIQLFFSIVAMHYWPLF